MRPPQQQLRQPDCVASGQLPETPLRIIPLVIQLRLNDSTTHGYAWSEPRHGARWLAMAGEVISTPPCLFCVINH